MLRLASKKRLLPQPAGTTVVMIAWNGVHRKLQGADGRTGRCDRRFGGVWRIKQVAADHDELRAMLMRDFANAGQAREALLPQQGLLGGIFHPGERFSELPISSVKEAHGPGTVSESDGGSRGQIIRLIFLPPALGRAVRPAVSQSVLAPQRLAGRPSTFRESFGFLHAPFCTPGSDNDGPGRSLAARFLLNRL